MASKTRFVEARDHISLLVYAAFFLLAGCNEVDLEPAANTQQLCQEYYEACINPLLTQPHSIISRGVSVTCSSAGCHDNVAGSGGAFKIDSSAQAGTDAMTTNYHAARGFTNLSDPVNSKLLLEPLAGSDAISGTHGGGDIFADPNDSAYQEIYYWITHPRKIATEACPQLDHYPNDPSRRCLADGL